MMVVGRSGQVMNLPEHLARALMRDGSVWPADEVPPATGPSPDPAPRADGQAPATDPELAVSTYGCDKCPAVAKTPQGLAAHKRSHSGHGARTAQAGG